MTDFFQCFSSIEAGLGVVVRQGQSYLKQKIETDGRHLLRFWPLDISSKVESSFQSPRQGKGFAMQRQRKRMERFDVESCFPRL